MGPVDAGSALLDRARLYDAYLRRWALPVGQVANVDFAAPDLAIVDHYDGTQDSAIWTGTYLAAQALRAKATASPDALAQVAALVRALHIDFNVAGDPGWLSRFSAPAASPPVITALFSASDPYAHFDGGYQGTPYLWEGHVSRDQYQGAILGYALAYEVLQDETLKEYIRSDVVTLVKELMKTRSVCVSFNGLPCLSPTNVQYTVVTSHEPLNISYANGSADFTGIQEFMPVLLGLVPRPSSAIMLTSFFEVALAVTAGVPAYAVDRSNIQQFFNANVDSWLSVAQLWVFQKNCNIGYYANNITFEPMYNLARLETDPTRLKLIRSTILENDLWAAVQSHKNVFFSYIYAANAWTPATGAAAVAAALPQLDQFPPPPRVHHAVSLNVPQDPSCPGVALDPIDVGERVVSDFLWQVGPWWESDPGNPRQVYPGVDYLVAYWMGRAHGFLADDRPGTCTRWLPP